MFVVKRVLMKHLQVAHPLLCQQQLITLLLRIYNRNISQGLYSESGLTPEEFATSIPENSFKSKWLRYNYTISDQSVIELLKNKKIKLSLNKTCTDICILLDNIELNREFTVVTDNKYLLVNHLVLI
jgi:hypothetical protein